MDIEEERKRIDQINEKIIDEVAERMDVVSDIADKKEKSDAEVKDSGREKKVKEQFRQGFKEHNLPDEKGKELAEHLMSIAKDYQRDRR